MAIYLSNDDVNELLSMKGCMKSIEGIYKEPWRAAAESAALRSD
jgi:hypothetical protein